MQTNRNSETIRWNSDPKKVKTNREKKICDTVTLEQKVEDIENRARLLENERRDLLLQCSGRVHKRHLKGWEIRV